MTWFLEKLNKIYFKFKVAFIGLFTGVKSDSSIQIQYLFGILACIIAFIFNFTWMEWIALLILIGLVIGFEYLNTAIEKLCDLVIKEENTTIKQIKDLSSGAVLFVSIISLIIGIMMILNHL